MTVLAPARRHVLAAVAVLGLSFVAGACDAAGAGGQRGEDVKALSDPAPPSTMAGLEVVSEEVADEVASVDDQYLEATALYSVRQGDKAVATLQISRFGEDARLEEEEFRDGFVANLGGQRGTRIRVADQNVQMTQGNLQRIAVWFRGDLVYVLTSRDDFDRPRTLLRESVAITKEG